MDLKITMENLIAEGILHDNDLKMAKDYIKNNNLNIRLIQEADIKDLIPISDKIFLDEPLAYALGFPKTT